jgi:hypothetical protein
MILVRSNPLDGVAILALSGATYRKRIQHLIWATGYGVVALPFAVGALYAWGVLLTPGLGAVCVAASTVTVGIHARLLRLKQPKPSWREDVLRLQRPVSGKILVHHGRYPIGGQIWRLLRNRSLNDVLAPPPDLSSTTRARAAPGRRTSPSRAAA